MVETSQARKQKQIVCVGGGHCNCQVLKLLKQELKNSSELDAKITLVNEVSKSYYSGMLPGTVSKLYTEEDLTVHMAPLAKWCNADYVEQRITKVVGNENRIILEDGSSIDYDILVLNVGSKTRGTTGEAAVGGVWENSLTTRPINDLLPKIRQKEEDLMSKGITPEVLICGAGAAGTELAFGFKHRWSKLYGKEIKVTLISAADTVLKGAHESTIKQVARKLKEANIHVEYNCKVKQIDTDGVQLADGRKIMGNVPVWATGAEAQMVSAESDLELLDGYFRVNDFMQSTSHPNVFAGGDCVTMETYAKEHFPPKAGVYAVRAGPFIAQNVSRYLKGEDMLKYVPQREFLSLLMTGDERAIGAKFGITFVGRWVWLMKDYIDMSFMDLFNANYLFEDYKNLGTAKPIEANELFEDETKKEADKLVPIRQRAAELDAKQAAELLGCDEEETEFLERLMLIQRMNADPAFASEVVKHYKPSYYSQ